ncbi:hypothetical protein A8H35_31960 [Burkholderia thailandensis]|nr:hypothetical protein A8H35_31960 [Burkholderia thailandensis]AWY64559.1 hypothetical protein A8H36_04175 [Burkholderia thailandensis]PHH33749.1 hypothetical protein CRX59_23925 [Burkholderia thailandensis]
MPNAPRGERGGAGEPCGRACITDSRDTLARESMRLCETGNRTRSDERVWRQSAGRRSGEAACGRCAATVHDGS